MVPSRNRCAGVAKGRRRSSRGREAHDGHDHRRVPGLETEAEGLAFAREVLRIEAEALERVRDRLGGSIARAADLVYRCPGSVIVTGMGKAGLVGQKLAATLASTGTRAFPLHPAEAVHGDLGRIRGRRRGARAVAERRDRGGAPAGPGAPAARGRA